MTLNDRARISGDGSTGIGSGGAFTANIECVVFGGITSYGNVTLKDRTVVNGNIFTQGTVTRINQPVINGFYRENMSVELFTIPTYTVTPGSTDKPVANNGSLVLAPGNYRDLTANSFSTLRLSAGVYQFRKFTTYSDVHIMLNAPSGEVIIRVAGECSIGDRTHIESFSGNINPLNIQWYCHQSTQVSVGTDCRMIGVFTAPNYTFKLGARSTLKGTIYAKSIIIDLDAKVEKCNDTRYVDSDFDDVPDVVETAMGTNPANGASKPDVAKPSSWYADASQTITVHYDLTMFPGYFSHADVPIVIPAGVNTRAYNPIISIVDTSKTPVSTAVPPTHRLETIYEIKAGIAANNSLMFGFPLPGTGIDISCSNKDRLLLQHYNSMTSTWETVTIDHIENNVAYAQITSASKFTLSSAGGIVGLDTLNNLRVYISDNPATVLKEKGWNGNPDRFFSDDERRLATAVALDLYRTVLPQMRYRFVDDTVTGNVGRANMWMYWCEDLNAFQNNACYTGSAWVAGLGYYDWEWEDIPNFNRTCPNGDHNTINYRSDKDYYTLAGNNFVAREEVYFDRSERVANPVEWRSFIDARYLPTPTFTDDLLFQLPGGTHLTGMDITQLIRHEFGHTLGFYDHDPQFDPALKTQDADGCITCKCKTEIPYGTNVAGVCRPMPTEYEGVMEYNDMEEHSNERLMREFDVHDLVAGKDYLVSYPYTRMTIRMQNKNGLMYTTNNWYDVRYRMFETPFTLGAANNNPQRFFVMGLDSVMVSTVAGSNGVVGDVDGPALSSRLNTPRVLFINESNGDLYFGVSGKIKILSASGNVTTFAGTSTPGYANKPRLTAQFDADFCAPFCRDVAGSIYVCERNVNRIRKIDAAGNVTLFAGSATGTAGYTDAAGSAALFDWPSSMCIDGADNLYVADYNNHVIRKIDPAGVVTTFTGTGAAGNVDGPISAAQFRTPCGIAIGPTGNLYVAERDNFDIRLIDMAAIPPMVSRFAGDGITGYIDGPAATARFGIASDLHVDARGIVYVADAANSAIRKVYQGGVSTIAGCPGDPVVYRDGCGTDARFYDPNDVAADTKGNIFVTEGLNHTIRKISTHIPLTVNAPALGARLEDAGDAVWFDLTITDNIPHTISVTRDQLLSDVDATLFGPNNDYQQAATDVNVGDASFTTSTAGRYLLRVFPHTGAARSNGAFSVVVTNTRQIITVPAAVGNSTQVAGSFEREGDNDWFRIDLSAGSNIKLTLETLDWATGGLTAAPVIYMYMDEGGVPVGGVPRVSADNTDPNYWPRILRNGATVISSIAFKLSSGTSGNDNPGGIYWIRTRSGLASDKGTYKLRITRN